MGGREGGRGEERRLFAIPGFHPSLLFLFPPLPPLPLRRLLELPATAPSGPLLLGAVWFAAREITVADRRVNTRVSFTRTFSFSFSEDSASNCVARERHPPAEAVLRRGERGSSACCPPSRGSRTRKTDFRSLEWLGDYRWKRKKKRNCAFWVDACSEIRRARAETPVSCWVVLRVGPVGAVEGIAPRRESVFRWCRRSPMARNIAVSLEQGRVHAPMVKKTGKGVGAPWGRASCFPIPLQPQPHI